MRIPWFLHPTRSECSILLFPATNQIEEIRNHNMFFGNTEMCFVRRSEGLLRKMHQRQDSSLLGGQMNTSWNNYLPRPHDWSWSRPPRPAAKRGGFADDRLPLPEDRPPPPSSSSHPLPPPNLLPSPMTARPTTGRRRCAMRPTTGTRTKPAPFSTTPHRRRRRCLLLLLRRRRRRRL